MKRQTSDGLHLTTPRGPSTPLSLLDTCVLHGGKFWRALQFASNKGCFEDGLTPLLGGPAERKRLLVTW